MTTIATLDIHTEIKNRLQKYNETKKIPNLLFHGPFGSGKRSLVQQFLEQIYNGDKEQMKSYIMIVNCSRGKGIKFIREDMKFFAKSHINTSNGQLFKSVVLLNADYLTIDAQSALRRSIELYSHNTRFFAVLENKNNLMKPILSRFCEIYVGEPTIKNRKQNLHAYANSHTFPFREIKIYRAELLKRELSQFSAQLPITPSKVIEFSNTLYNMAYSSIDIIRLLENSKYYDNILSELNKQTIIFEFERYRIDIRNERLLISIILTHIMEACDASNNV